MVVRNQLIRVFLALLLFVAIAPSLFAKDSGHTRPSHIEGLTREYVDTLYEHARRCMRYEDSFHYALEDLLLAYQYAQDLGYKQGVINGCKELGNFYLGISDNANATMYFYLLLHEAEEVGDTLLIADGHIRLGLVMYNMNKWSEALTHIVNAEVFVKTKDIKKTSIQLISYLKGLCYMRLGRDKEAKVLLEKCRDWAHENGDSMRFYESKLALLRIELNAGVTEEMLEGFEELLSYFERHNEKVGTCFALEGRANALLKLGKSDEAFQDASIALQIAKSLDLIYPLSEILETLVEAEKQRGNYKSALDYLMELEVLRDSVNNMEVATQIAMLGASHQFEKKEAEYDAEIKAKNKQRRFFLMLFVLMLIVAIIIVIMLRLVATQRRKSDLLLHNILPVQTIKELQRTGHSIPKAHKNVTIVFADVESFTRIASTLKPAVLVKMLDRYFGNFDAIITKYGLEKIKTIGDAYMFVSGLIPDPRSAHKAAKACLEMIKSIHVLQSEMEEEFGISFGFRFGMHTGNVVSGVVGDIKYAFDIWGDAVNIAARMEETSETGKINVSEDTKNLISDEYLCIPRGAFTIKNRGVVEMFYLQASELN